MDNSCSTKYPIMLIHGIGYIDGGKREYWGRIPEFLNEKGAELYFGNQSSFGDIDENAFQLKQSVMRVIEETGAEKLNLIAHSKGGIEARYMISMLDMDQKIASLTTIATPHRGIKTMDNIKKRSNFLFKRLVSLFNLMVRVDSGEKHKELKLYDQFTADYMSVFNDLVKDSPNVYYQSYAFDMKSAASDPVMALFYTFIKHQEGINDGLISVESAKWGEFKGVYSGPGKIGISHPNAVDGRKRAVTDKKGEGVLDITDLYWDIVSGLKSLGY